MTTVAMLWRIRSEGRELPAEAVAATLRGFEFVTRVTTERDETGDLLVGLFAHSSDAKTALDSTKTAIAAATEDLGHVTSKIEWAGVIQPEPDPTKPESFPAIPTARWLRQRGQWETAPELSEADYRVTVRVSGLDLATGPALPATLLENMRAMQRVARPKLTLESSGASVLFEFDVGAPDPEGARIAALDATEAVLSASLDANAECDLNVIRVRRAISSG